MIKLFNSTDTLFSNNGDKIIIPTKAKIHKEDNGAYYLDLETNLDYINDLVQGKIIVAPTPTGEQAFRISNATATRKKLTAKCYHVFYDSKNYLIEDSYVVDKDCNDALNHLNSATSDLSPFTTLSDVTDTKNSYRCVRKSLYEAINTVLERWGGHLVRNNFNIQIRENIGQDNGVTVRYAKNLKTITCETNWDNVVTKLLPVGKDGFLLNSIDETADLYITSNNQYDIPYTKTVSFEQDIDEEDYKDQEGNLNEEAYNNALIEDLRLQGNQYLEENCVPKVNYTLKANIEKITDIGDTIEVIDERLGINLYTNVISYDYNCLTEKYETVEFGNFKNKLSDLISNINASTQKELSLANQQIQENIKEASNEIWNTLDSNNVTFDGNELLIYESLPQDAANRIMKFNKNGVSFSKNGKDGPFSIAWTLDNILTLKDLIVNGVNILNTINNIMDRISGVGETAKSLYNNNWNTICGNSTGIYQGSNMTNSPTATENTFLLLHIASSSTNQRQVAFSIENNDGIYTRIMNNSSWSEWLKII